MPRKTNFKVNLGNRIKNLRLSNNFTQEELGKKINVKKTTITNYESGYSEPEGEKLLELSKIFDVSLDYLLGNICTKMPIKTLNNTLTSIHLSNIELENVFRLIMNYYSDDNNIINPIDTSNLNEREKQAISAFSIITSDYFSHKLSIELGDDFELFYPHSEKEKEKIFVVKNFMQKKINEIIDLLDKRSIVEGDFNHLAIYDNSTIGMLNSSMSVFNDWIYAYKTNDESMSPLLGIGDIAIIEKTDAYENEQTYLFTLDNDILIRKVVDFNTHIELQAINYHFDTIKLTKEDMNKRNFKILGEVIEAKNQSAFKKRRKEK